MLKLKKSYGEIDFTLSIIFLASLRLLYLGPDREEILIRTFYLSESESPLFLGFLYLFALFLA